MIAQVILVLSCILIVAVRTGDAGSGSPFVQPVGFGYLIAWAIFIVAWTPFTYDLAFSVGYTMWFLLSVAVIFSLLQYYRSKHDQIRTLYKAYLNSYVFVAVFGLFQFALGIVGIDLLVTQWWIPNRLPRINGFSYEPSYFSTYLIIGWGMFAWLVERRIYLFSRLYTNIAFASVSLAIVLSSSRMAILILIAYGVYYILKNLIWGISKFRIRKSFLTAVFWGVSAAISVSAAIIATVGFGGLRFLLFGTGLAGEANHSAIMRYGQLEDTISLIRESPFIGYGLGGVWSYIGQRHGVPVTEVTGMNITAEVLAATGLIGFPFFIMFIATNIFSSFRSLKRGDELSEALAAAGVGLVLVLTILQFNQSIMRVYLWNHFAIIAILYYFVSQRSKVSASKLRLNISRANRRYSVS